MGAHIAMRMASAVARVPALILTGLTAIFEARCHERRWLRRLDLRFKQVLDHFSPAAPRSPHVQHYARMVCELNNPSTVASIIAANKR